MKPTLIFSLVTMCLVTTATCRTVRESIKRNTEHQSQARLKHLRNQFAAIQEALTGSVESSEGSRHDGPSYRIDLGEALEAESFRAAAVSSDSLEYSQEVRNPEEKESETSTLFPVQSVLGSHSHWLKSDLDEDDMEEDEEALDDGCDEGEVMRISCNSCVCINSQYVCSKKDCQEPEIPLPPSMKHNSKNKKGPLNYNKKAPPAAIDESGNALYGEYFSSEADFATGNDTVPREDGSSSELLSCIDGRTKPVDCNHCICAMGRWACTKTSCIPMSLREKASFHGAEFIKKADTLKENIGIDEDCMEGDTKRVGGCNQCVCHENSWACTDFECPSASPPDAKPNANTIKLEACQTEEDVKSVECNICSCRSGIWRCTNNDCKKFGDKYYQPFHRPQKTTPLVVDSDSAENHSFL